jgi:hypothetical protein
MESSIINRLLLCGELVADESFYRLPQWNVKWKRGKRKGKTAAVKGSGRFRVIFPFSVLPPIEETRALQAKKTRC